jgi:hypothetical protein
MKIILTEIVISIFVLAGMLFLAYTDTNAYPQEISVKEHPATERNVAIFHDLTSAQHWANEMHGQIVKGENETYLVVYNETAWESTPADWRDK